MVKRLPKYLSSKNGKMRKIDENAGGNYKLLKEVAHTSVYLAIICGIVYTSVKIDIMLLMWIIVGVPIGLFALTACMLWFNVNQ